MWKVTDLVAVADLQVWQTAARLVLHAAMAAALQAYGLHSMIFQVVHVCGRTCVFSVNLRNIILAQTKWPQYQVAETVLSH